MKRFQVFVVLFFIVLSSSFSQNSLLKVYTVLKHAEKSLQRDYSSSYLRLYEKNRTYLLIEISDFDLYEKKIEFRFI